MASTPPWFYHPFDALKEDTVELTGKEANHIIGAQRLRLDDQLVLMNGRGSLAHGMLVAADKKRKIVRLRVSLVARVNPRTKPHTLATALPKGDRLSTMLDMACQIGITGFQPLEFERSVRKWSPQLKIRCERVLLESAKQSKQAWVPEVYDSMPYSEWLAEQDANNVLVLLANQFGSSLHAHQSAIQSATGIALVVGPEGGLSQREMELAKQRQLPSLRLADNILRVETAAVTGMSLLHTL